MCQISKMSRRLCNTDIYKNIIITFHLCKFFQRNNPAFIKLYGCMQRQQYGQYIRKTKSSKYTSALLVISREKSLSYLRLQKAWMAVVKS